MTDASETGLRIESPEALVAGQVVIVKVRHAPDLPALAAQVVWTRDNRAGLSVLRERPEGAAAWRDTFTLPARKRQVG